MIYFLPSLMDPFDGVQITAGVSFSREHGWLSLFSRLHIHRGWLRSTVTMSKHAGVTVLAYRSILIAQVYQV